MLVVWLIIVGCSTDNDENPSAENAIGPEGGNNAEGIDSRSTIAAYIMDNVFVTLVE